MDASKWWPQELELEAFAFSSPPPSCLKRELMKMFVSQGTWLGS